MTFTTQKYQNRKRWGKRDGPPSFVNTKRQNILRGIFRLIKLLLICSEDQITCSVAATIGTLDTDGGGMLKFDGKAVVKGRTSRLSTVETILELMPDTTDGVNASIAFVEEAFCNKRAATAAATFTSPTIETDRSAASCMPFCKTSFPIKQK